jgi:hypothetical protein
MYDTLVYPHHDMPASSFAVLLKFADSETIPIFAFTHDTVFHESFIGLVVHPGHALIDTGAEDVVIGEPALNVVEEHLKLDGLKPRVLPTTTLQVAGDNSVTVARVCGRTEL